MSMSELHKPEWYGEYAVIKNKYNDYVQVEYKCNGTGSLYDYDLFPGIDFKKCLECFQRITVKQKSDLTFGLFS